jgi:hypothetical protein
MLSAERLRTLEFDRCGTQQSYNFAKVHMSLRVSLAMAAEKGDRSWSYEDVIGLLKVSEPSDAEIGKKRHDTRKPD